MPEPSQLPVVARTTCWLGWHHHFGPASGSDPKSCDPLGRYCVTVFTGGVNIGQREAATHIAGVSARQLSMVRNRHIDLGKLAAIAAVVSASAELDVVQAWGTAPRWPPTACTWRPTATTWPLAPTSVSPDCVPTAAATPSARASARAEPTPPRSRPSSGMPPSTQRPGTSAPDQPRTPPSLTVRSIADYPLTGPLPPSGFTWSGRQQVRVVRVAEYVGLVRGKEREHAARRDQGPGQRRGVGQLFSRL
jgi:hypothetical protein